MARTIHLTGNIMSTHTNPAPASANHSPRWCQILWLTALLVVSPVAASYAGDEVAAGTGTQPMLHVPAPDLSDEVLELAHAKGFYWEALPAMQSAGVILWDESGNIRRTGSGQSNAQTSGTTVVVSRR